jgi:hypothetical protein
MTEIYIALLDEGTDVWRPTPAKKLADSTYLVLKPSDYDPEDENWQFPPGSTVVCEPRSTSQGVLLTAVRLKDQGRRTA